MPAFPVRRKRAGRQPVMVGWMLALGVNLLRLKNTPQN